MRRLITLALATAALLAAFGAVAPAHVSTQHFGWYWRLGTTDLNNDNKVLDPIDIVWTSGKDYGPMTESQTEAEVEANWRGRPSHGQMNHGSICLGQSKIAHIIGDGRQNAWFRSDIGLGPHKVATWFQESTSSHCFSQYHMRFWNDSTHAQITANHGPTGQWAISGVHHDISTCTHRYPPVVGPRFGGCHKISGHWGAYRNYAVNRAMKRMCGRSRWRMYPGGDRKFQGHRFDGYEATIRGTFDSSGCPNGLY